MFGKVHKRVHREIYLILHLVFLTKHCTAFINDKIKDLNPEKYEDIYDENRLQNNAMMNMFGTYPTVILDEKPNAEEKFIETDEKTKFVSETDLIDGKTILKIMEDTPLYQLCFQTLNVPERCLSLILKNNNIRKIFTDKQQFCGSLPTKEEFYQCIQQFQQENYNFNKFLEKNILIPAVKKYKNISDTPKRLPFHAWGGKRFNQVGTDKIQTSRVPFNAWGGKRSENDNEELCEPCKRSKAKFHSWGGKRSKRKSI